MERRRRRIGAYGICRDERGRTLLLRAGPGSHRAGTWLLPGGDIGHGEHPADAVVRLVAEQTGLAVRRDRVREVAAEVVDTPDGPEHTDAIVYDLIWTGGDPRRPAGSADWDRYEWVPPARLADLPLAGHVTRALGQSAESDPAVAGGPGQAVPAPAPGSGTGSTAGGPRLRRARGQRFGAYGLVTDPAGRLLLTLIADGYPGEGRWHPPGGGTDFGEQPRDALRREVAEETGQVGRITELLDVTSRHTRAARGPEGHPVDWHAVRAVFRVVVDRPTQPRVIDVGGSTADARWVTPVEAARLPLTDLAQLLLARM